MARLEDLVAQVPDQALRLELESALSDLKKRLRFGLVFEEHIPELAILRGLPATVGALVQVKSDEHTYYRVVAIDGTTATVARLEEGPTQASVMVPIADLLVIKRFGDPIYPSLRPLGQVTRGGLKPYHCVIEGENLHALQLLIFLFEGRVDCIYIDPPYNTGAKDWKYNNRYVDKVDTWRHSKWLSFMDKRLRLARRLLRTDGVLVVTVDENEHAHLVLLLEQLFKRHEITSVAIVHNPRGVQGDNFSYTNEFAVFVVPNGVKAITRRSLDADEISGSNLRKWGGESDRATARNCFYPIIVQDDRVVGFGDVAPEGHHPSQSVIDRDNGTFEVWPIDSRGVEKKWRYARQSVEQIKHQLATKAVRGRIEIIITKETGIYKTVWQSPLHDASTHGKQLLGRFIDGEFSYPKSLYAVRDCLRACTADRPNALVLDFFAGSGTTLHATALLNAEDGGSRQCILVTNNEVDDATAKRLHAEGRYRGDADFEKHGIFEAVTRPRIEAAMTGLKNGQPVDGTYETSMRPLGAGFDENVEFFKLVYLDADEVDLGTQFQEILPALWLKSGGIGDRSCASSVPFAIPPGVKFGVLFDEARFERFAQALRDRPDVSHIFLITDSEGAFADMRSRLPARLDVSMLYRDYLRNFRINTAQNL